MLQILGLIQLAVTLLVGAQNGTVEQKQQAITFTTQVVTLAQSYIAQHPAEVPQQVTEPAPAQTQDVVVGSVSTSSLPAVVNPDDSVYAGFTYSITPIDASSSNLTIQLLSKSGVPLVNQGIHLLQRNCNCMKVEGWPWPVNETFISDQEGKVNLTVYKNDPINNFMQITVGDRYSVVERKLVRLTF